MQKWQRLSLPRSKQHKYEWIVWYKITNCAMPGMQLRNCLFHMNLEQLIDIKCEAAVCAAQSSIIWCIIFISSFRCSWMPTHFFKGQTGLVQLYFMYLSFSLIATLDSMGLHLCGDLHVIHNVTNGHRKCSRMIKLFAQLLLDSKIHC